MASPPGSASSWCACRLKIEYTEVTPYCALLQPPRPLCLRKIASGIDTALGKHCVSRHVVLRIQLIDECTVTCRSPSRQWRRPLNL